VSETLVDVLRRSTQSHAPLSSAQCIKAFQELEDKNRITLRKLTDFQHECEMKLGAGDNKDQIATMCAQISSLQEELVKTNTRLSAQRVDVVGNAANIVVLQEQAGKNTEGLNQMKEGQKVTNTNVHNLREEHLLATNQLRNLQKEVAGLKEAKENVLQLKLDQAVLAMQQCKQDVETTKLHSFKNEDSIRDLKNTLTEAQAEIAKLELLG